MTSNEWLFLLTALTMSAGWLIECRLTARYRQIAKEYSNLFDRAMDGWQEGIDLNLKILAMHQEERDRNKKPRRAADG